MITVCNHGLSRAATVPCRAFPALLPERRLATAYAESSIVPLCNIYIVQEHAYLSCLSLCAPGFDRAGAVWRMASQTASYEGRIFRIVARGSVGWGHYPIACIVG